MGLLHAGGYFSLWAFIWLSSSLGVFLENGHFGGYVAYTGKWADQFFLYSPLFFGLFLSGKHAFCD